MLSFQLKEQINDILNAFDEAQYFFDLLDHLDKSFKFIEGKIKVISVGESEAQHAHNQIRSHLAQVKNRLGNIRPRKLFATIEKLQTNINSIKEYEFYDSSLLDEIHEILEVFLHLYEEFIYGGYLPKDAGALVLEANSLSALLDGVKKSLNLYVNNIEVSTLEYNDDKSEISILLPSTMDLSEFILKLKAFENIYKELCMILNISIEDYPIEIIKIESGSWFTNLLGHKTIIDFIVKIMESGALYLHRNYTKEGKVGSIPKKVESIESVLKLKLMLTENEIDTDGMNDHLQKASISIAKELNTLISGQNQITVNDTTLLITKEAEQEKLLQHDAPLRLEKDD